MSSFISGFTLDTAFPGGNIIIERVEDDTVFLHQDLRDTQRDWFYWAFRVRGAAGRRLTFIFTGSPLLTGRGAAVSRDSGSTWSWLGIEACTGNGFSYDFAPHENEVCFALAPAYTMSHWQNFTAGLADLQKQIRLETLCQTRQGRAVPALFAGNTMQGMPRLVLTSRHHACESMANYVLEGLLTELLAKPKVFAAMAVPFIDLDGVENGDQGKCRAPHDHNRDYGTEPLYEATAALKARLPAWIGAAPGIILDLHCPMHREAYHERIMFVAGPGTGNGSASVALANLLEKTTVDGPLPFHAADLLPFGTEWNVSEAVGMRFDEWAATLPGIRLAAILEIPYAAVGPATVTAASARALGRQVAAALLELRTAIPGTGNWS